MFTGDLKNLTIEATLRGAAQENETNSTGWCNYPLGEFAIIHTLENRSFKDSLKNVYY